jgi:hypothetical protein
MDKTYRNYSGIFLLFFQWILFKIITQNQNWIENYYINGFYKFFTQFLRKTTSFFPFSIGLILVYALFFLISIYLGYSIYQIYQKRKKLIDFLLNVSIWLPAVYLYYMLTWGLAYHKLPIEKLMNLNKERITEKEYQQLAEKLVIDTNKSKIESKNSEMLDFEKIFQKADLGYKKLTEKYAYLNYTNPSIKIASGSNLLSYMSTSGIYMFPTGEANVNANNVLYHAPFVTCHEMAHQLGFASEDEANFLAYISCINHPDPQFKYAANYGVVFRALSKVAESDSIKAKMLYEQLNPLVIEDFKKEIALWKKYKNPIQKYLISPFYDLFLKSNGVEEGAKSYDLVIDLLVAMERENIIQKNNLNDTKKKRLLQIETF